MKSATFYAMTLPGLEDIARTEISEDLKGDIKITHRGLVVFKTPRPVEEILELKTTEDVFLYGWGTDSLTYRATDLDDIRKWTTKDADWNHLIHLHHQVHPLTKGRPTYRIITQMEGTHGYHRKDAQRAFTKAITSKIPASWKMVEDNSHLEFWLTIDEKTAVAGLRLTDKTMRHRDYKIAHRPASLRPSVAGAMVRLAQTKPNHQVLDPMCGAGTILAEYQLFAEGWRVPHTMPLGGDSERSAVMDANANLRKLGGAFLCQWDARRLPLRDGSVERIICNPPFGKQLAADQDLSKLYRNLTRQFDRVLAPKGKAVLLVSEFAVLREACEKLKWACEKRYRARILGQMATISLWQKPDSQGTLSPI